jgi:hypothetical protein
MGQYCTKKRYFGANEIFFTLIGLYLALNFYGGALNPQLEKIGKTPAFPKPDLPVSFSPQTQLYPQAPPERDLM